MTRIAPFPPPRTPSDRHPTLRIGDLDLMLASLSALAPVRIIESMLDRLEWRP
jgi:hypothetical protein